MVAPGGDPDPQQPQLSGEAPAEGGEAPAASAAPPVAPGGTLAAAMATASAASHGGGPPARSQDPSRTVFVGGLPPEATEPVLRVFFQPFGTLTSVRLISDPRTGRSKGYAFVTFADEAAAAAVKARGKLDVYGRTVDVGAPQGSRPPGTHRAGAAGIPADRRAFVGGLPREATEPLMAAFFSAFGTVVDFKVVMDPATGVSRGFGFVAFEHAASADALKSMRTIDFFGKTLNVGEARRNGGGGGMIDPNALAAAYVAAGYHVLPLGQFPAHRGAVGMDGSMAYTLDPSSYASFPPIAASSAALGHQHTGGGYGAAQEHHRRTEMQF